MTHTYQVSSMTYNGCRANVQKTLSELQSAEKVDVNFEEKLANIEMEKHKKKLKILTLDIKC